MIENEENVYDEFSAPSRRVAWLSPRLRYGPRVKMRRETKRQSGTFEAARHPGQVLLHFYTQSAQHISAAARA